MIYITRNLGAAILSKFCFSTDIYPVAERFDGWREEFARRIINSDIRRADDPSRDSFYASTEVWHLGDVKFARSVRSPVEMSRSAAQASQSDDSFGLIINAKGGLHATQDGIDSLNEAPGAVLVRHDRVHRVGYFPAAAGSQAMAQILSYTLPRRALLSVAPEALTRLGGALPPNPALVKYLMQYSTDIVASAALPDESAGLAGAIGDHILDLVALLLGPSRDAAEVASRRGLRAARLKSILAFVADNISDPALDVAMVAHRHGIGTRYVSQLMEEKGETLTKLIQRLRLEKAASMLSDPASRALRIGEIASACGFADPAHFNRSFRRHYGETPKSFRG